MIEQVVFSQSFAMIRGDHDQGLIEHAPAPQLVEQMAKPLVQISEAVIIRISAQGSRLAGRT